MICSLPTLLAALPGALTREGDRALEGASDLGAAPGFRFFDCWSVLS